MGRGDPRVWATAKSTSFHGHEYDTFSVTVTFFSYGLILFSVKKRRNALEYNKTNTKETNLWSENSTRTSP
jgi:hypothetical protein